MIIEFLYLVGLIIGLGSVTVIDTLGFVSRKSKEWTQVTIMAHYVTKPLIWLGTILLFLSLILKFIYTPNEYLLLWKFLIVILLILNGIFLSFYVSPRLIKLRGKNKLLPKKLQNKIKVSMIISFLGWWSFVVLTIMK